MCRGDRREDIFLTDADRELFLTTLGEVCGKTGWMIHAYVLMPNHYHLLVETPESNLVAGMRWFQGTYTTRFNCRNRLSGHLFQGRYKAVIVDGKGGGYLRTVSTYIHLNPVRAKLSKPNQIEHYSWSSLPGYLSKRNRPSWLHIDRVLGEMGLMDNRAGLRQYLQMLRDRAVREHVEGVTIQKEYESIRRGWCIGDDKFRKTLLGLVSYGTQESFHKTSRGGAAVNEHNESTALRILKSGLKDAGLTLARMRNLPWTDNRKAKLARLIRGQTTMTNAWVAKQLGGGHDSTVSRAVHRQR